MGRLRILNIFVEDYEVFGIIFLIYVCALLTHHLQHSSAKLLQKSEMRKDIVIELSYKGFG